MPCVTDRPARVVLVRGGSTLTVGDGGDLSWADVEALQLQRDRQQVHAREGRVIARQLSAEHVQALAGVLRVFPGAVVEDWSMPVSRRAGRAR